jgi:hypothetical protein
MIAAREVAFEKTAGQLLEKKLNKKLSHKTGKKYEVLNFGVPGYGVDQMYLNWDLIASKYNSDFLFIYMFENNYFRTISPSWCQKGFFGLNYFGKPRCLRIRPFALIRKEEGEFIPKKMLQNIPFDLYYINLSHLKMFRELQNKNDINEFFSLLETLPLKVFPPAMNKQFVEEQNKYIKSKMNGKRMIKKEKKSFIIYIFSEIFDKLKKLSKTPKPKENIWEEIRYKGDSKNFPSWLTNNLVNLKLIQVLGNSVKQNKGQFIIIDTFKFYNRSTPPLDFSSEFLQNLSKFSNFGYIPLYNKLDNAKDNGTPVTWKYDPHLNELGNEIFANALFNYLEKKEIIN